MKIAGFQSTNIVSLVSILVLLSFNSSCQDDTVHESRSSLSQSLSFSDDLTLTNSPILLHSEDAVLSDGSAVGCIRVKIDDETGVVQQDSCQEEDIVIDADGEEASEEDISLGLRGGGKSGSSGGSRKASKTTNPRYGSGTGSDSSSRLGSSSRTGSMVFGRMFSRYRSDSESTDGSDDDDVIDEKEANRLAGVKRNDAGYVRISPSGLAQRKRDQKSWVQLNADLNPENINVEAPSQSSKPSSSRTVGTVTTTPKF